MTAGHPGVGSVRRARGVRVSGVTFVYRTEASKLTRSPMGRPVAATHVAQASCPSDCLFRGGGCYAELGPEGYITRRLASEVAATSSSSSLALALNEARAIYAAIARDPGAVRGVPLRLHVVGDCADALCASVVARAASAWVACGGGVCWTYSHSWRTVARSCWGAVSVLASCETLGDVAEARLRGYGVALVGDWDTGLGGPLRSCGGAFVCPQQTGQRADCASCMACARIGRAVVGAGSAVLVLRPHGPNGVPTKAMRATLAVASAGAGGRKV